MSADSFLSAYEFFAGGGMARLGLGSAWRIGLANDIDPAKARQYRGVFQDEAMREGDVWSLSAKDAPGQADLAWASFPCQDLSLAGARGGLNAPRSGAFWGFWRLIETLNQEHRAPRLLCLENVAGLLTSNRGRDFATLCATLDAGGYRVGALSIDASAFLPQSRPRIFIVAARTRDVSAFVDTAPAAPFHNEALQSAVALLPVDLQQRFVWWRLPAAPTRNTDLSALLEHQPGVCWDGPEKTARILAMMSATQRARIERLQADGALRVGALFKRIRIEQGEKVQRAEARFDGLAGCLRTPAGGSSRQALIFIEGARVRTRLLSAREAARLMGLDDSYPLPKSQSAGLHLIGDGVAVPVVRHLSHHLLEPLARALRATRKAA